MLGSVNTRLVQTNPQNPVVYLGADNSVVVAVTQYDGKRFVAVDFTDVDRMVLTLMNDEADLPFVFDSATVPEAVVWSAGSGRVQFFLSNYALPVGTYEAQLLVFDTEHPDGQVVIDNEVTNILSVLVRDATLGGLLPPPRPELASTVVRPLGQTLSALRVVYESQGAVYLLDPSTDFVDQLLGITLTAGSQGANATVRREGTIDEPSWSWNEGLVFLGPNGTLTQVPPTTGWEVVVGFSPSPTRLNIDFDEPVLLA